MNRLLRTVLSAAVAVPAVGALPPAAALAAPAQHDLYVEDYDGSVLVTADDNACGPWEATLFERRSGAYKLVVTPNGQLQVNGAVDGQVRLVPSDPALPAYAGTYREKANAVITGVDETGEDLSRVGQYRLRVAMTGTDGSDLVLVESGKVTFDAHGTAVVEREVSSCRLR